MKKLIIPAIIMALYLDANAQNQPDGSSFSVTTPNPTISTPSAFSLGGSPVYNYTRTFEPQYAETNESLISETSSNQHIKTTTAYTDGFGRPLQTILWRRSTSGAKDVVQQYDNRTSQHQFQFLPYPSSPGSSFHSSPYTEQSSYYSTVFPDDASYAMSETSYSSAPGNRSTYSYRPGASAVGSSNGTKTWTNRNALNEVIIWKVNSITGWPQKIGYYAEGALKKQITTNTDGQQVSEYFDNEGKLICKSILATITDCGMVNYSNDAAEPNSNTHLPGTTSVFDPITNDYALGAMIYSDQNSEPQYSQGQLNPWLPEAYFSPYSSALKYPTIAKCPTYILTYYVYDKYERLTYTLPPKAVQYLAANIWVPTADIISNLCDFVVYDDFGRIVEKHQAGQNGNVEMVYDNHDRVILTKYLNDASSWKWSHYDKLNRIIQTGAWTDSRSRATLQGYFDGASIPVADNASSKLLYYLFNETQQGIYINSALTGADFYNTNYFDNYDNLSYFDGSSSHSLSFTYNTAVFSGNTISNTRAVSVPSTPSLKTHGLPTCSISKVIKPGTVASLGDYTSSANFFDDYGRVVETIANNAVGGTDVVGKQYDFRGRTISDISKIHNPLCSAQVYRTIVSHDYYFDYSFLLNSTSQSIDGESSRTIATYAYNDLGQAKTKVVGGVENQKLTYNVRGELTGINGYYAETKNKEGRPVTFGVSLKREEGFSKKLYCGNVSGILWRYDGGDQEAYGYTYDYAGRMVQADYRNFADASVVPTYPPVPIPWTNASKDYTEAYINYDGNGNITTLKRWGPGSTAPTIIDNLTYAYETSDKSNRIKSVSDATAVSSTTSLQYDFKDRNTTSTADCSYDNSGNIIGSLDKEATTTYTFFNKPQQVTFTNGDYIKYVYESDGAKIAEIFYDHTTSTTTQTDYVGPAQFKNNIADIINHGEGFSKKSTSIYDYFYFVRDHLGNVRNLLATVYASAISEEPSTHVFEASYIAGHETGDAQTEQGVFDNIQYVRADKPASTDQADLKAAELDASDSTKVVGTSLMLKVMSGDEFEISAESYYSSADFSSPGTIDQNQFLNSIFATLVNGQGGAGNLDANHISDLSKIFTADNIGIYNAFMDTTSSVDTSRPQAFINYLLFDEDFKIIPSACGRIQIPAGADQWNDFGTPQKIPIDHSGYLTTFVSLWTPGGSVFIDHFSVFHYKGSLLESKRYYPYGLPVNVSTALTPTYPENKYLYQAKKQEKVNGLYMDDFHARQYDPQLGRFAGIDPAGQFASGYTGMGNQPSRNTDPTGKFVVLDSWLIGFGHGFFSTGKGRWKSAWKTANKRAGNDARIWGGLFATDKNKTTGGRLVEIVSRFTWQLPQTIGGFGTAHTYNTLGLQGGVESVHYAYGATVVKTENYNYGAAVTQGSFIVGDNTIAADANNALFQHEYGHYIQSQQMGLAYYPRVGIPSGLSGGKYEDNHDYHPVEMDANRRAFLYFNKRVGGFQNDVSPSDNKGWNFSANPMDIDGDGAGNYIDYKNATSVDALNTLKVRARWYDYASWLTICTPLGPLVPIGAGMYNTWRYNR